MLIIGLHTSLSSSLINADICLITSLGATSLSLTMKPLTLLGPLVSLLLYSLADSSRRISSTSCG